MWISWHQEHAEIRLDPAVACKDQWEKSTEQGEEILTRTNNINRRRSISSLPSPPRSPWWWPRARRRGRRGEKGTVTPRLERDDKTKTLFIWKPGLCTQRRSESDTVGLNPNRFQRSDSTHRIVIEGGLSQLAETKNSSRSRPIEACSKLYSEIQRTQPIYWSHIILFGVVYGNIELRCWDERYKKSQEELGSTFEGQSHNILLELGALVAWTVNSLSRIVATTVEKLLW